MKILSQESNIGIATTVSSATAVRLYNSDSSAGIVTRTDSSDNTIGDLTVPAGEVLYLEKKSTDKLLAPSTVLASKVAYSQMMYYASYSSGGGGYTDGDIVTSNLTYHLDANNSSSYGGSGTTWTDLVAGSNNATINGATYTEGAGDQGYYFDFDGANDYVEIGSPIVSGDTFTIELWCRNDAATMPAGTETAFTTEGNALDSTDLVAYQGDRWAFRGNGFIMNRTYTVHVPQAQEWNQVVAVVYKNNNSQVDIRAKIYLNGQLSNSISGLKNFGYSAGNGNILGRRSSTSGVENYWDGQISILRYYNAALTDANILTNYNANKGRYGLS